MKVTLKDGTVLDAVGVEKTYNPRNVQGIVFSIRMNSDADVEDLREIFNPDALESIIVGEGASAKTVNGYTQVDSIRKLYGGEADYDTAVDLVKQAGKEG